MSSLRNSEKGLEFPSKGVALFSLLRGTPRGGKGGRKGGKVPLPPIAGQAPGKDRPPRISGEELYHPYLPLRKKRLRLRKGSRFLLRRPAWGKNWEDL